MSIYTKTGDTGTTALFGGTRLPKYDIQIEAYGTIDEATSFIGSVYESIKDQDVKDLLTAIQHNLYKIMAYLSGADLQEKELASHITIFEKEIDHLEKTLPKLTRFILPQGSEQASRIHLARTIIRRAERRVVEFVDSKKEKTSEDAVCIQYLNRLSDLFFMLARKFSDEEKRT
jgi:cob(I)alamin adenosyltransferase